MAKTYACSVCSENCKTNCIFCETCKTWVHYRCQGLDESSRKIWQTTPLEYICVQCRSTDDGSYDYMMGLERLRQASRGGMKKLVTHVEREQLFLTNVPVNSAIHTDFNSHMQDPVANATLTEYYSTSKTAMQSTGDGDCLFNSFSTYLVGDESRSTELRYRCCIQMVSNRERIVRHKLYPRLKWISPDYDQDCLDCAKPGSYASVWNMIALSNLLNVKVESVYPSVNGCKHYAFVLLNTVFRPTFVDPEKETITVMWTNTSPPQKNQFIKKRKLEWFPNHFVPLVNTEEQSDTTKVYAEPEDSIFGSPVSVRHTECDESNVINNESEREESPSATYVPDLSAIQEESCSPNSLTDLSPTTQLVCSPTIQTNSENECENDTDSEEIEFVRGPLTKFMDLNATLNVFKGPHTVLREVPNGRKDGMYFVIDNSDNVDKRNSGKKSEFWDDCGTWAKGTSPSSIFVEREGTLISVVKRQGVFCVTKQVNNKREFIPLEPQPEESMVVTIHRNYQTLKSSPTGPDQFKKRITWVEKSDTTMPELSNQTAIVEYIGTFPGRDFYGSVKHTEKNVKYIRTKPKVVLELKNNLKNRSVKDVERELNQHTDSDFDKQRNEKQLRNIKYNMARKERPLNAQSNNIADHIVCVEEMTKSTDFVKSVKHLNGIQHPVVTLYTAQQMTDLKRFCCKEGGCVLGMDKTYNLGEFHVTPTVFKDLSVVKRSTDDHPICFGPTFIHQSLNITGSFRICYCNFLTNIVIHKYIKLNKNVNKMLHSINMTGSFRTT